MKTLLLIGGLALVGCGAMQDDNAFKAGGKKPPPPPAPTGSTGAVTYPDLNLPGVVACYLDGAPNQTCAPGEACYFDNYTASHNGYCSSSGSHTYGLETCDGNEDCASGNVCCVVMGRNAYDMITVTISCQASACPTAAGDYEMCHPTSNAWGTCTNTSKHCVPARDAAQYSIARNLYVCL